MKFLRRCLATIITASSLRPLIDWGLRDYGVEPVIWEHPDTVAYRRATGDWDSVLCEHVWGEERTITNSVPRDHDGAYAFADTRGQETQRKATTLNASQGQFCQDCGAWLGCLGLEPDPGLYVAHLVDIFRDVHRVLRDDGVLWLNLGDCYARQAGDNATRGTPNTGQKNPDRMATETSGNHKPPPGLKPKDLVGIPWLVAFALRADGWWLRSDVIWSKPNGMPESVRDRPTSAHEHVFLLSKSQRYFYDQDAIRENFADERMGNPGKYNKVSAEERKANNDRQDLGFINNGGGWERGAALGGRNKRDVWTIPTHPFPDSHFATFPPALVEICLKAGTSAYGCCPTCGAAWERVTERIDTGLTQKMADGWDTGSGGHGTIHRNGRQKGEAGKPVMANVTTGFCPTCDHDAAPVACRVLDPFGGAGTTGLVADRLGLDATLIEIKDEYAEMARARIAEDAPPMFASVELVGG